MKQSDLQNFYETWVDPATGKDADDIAEKIYDETGTGSGVVKEFNEAIEGPDVKDGIVELALLLRGYFDKARDEIGGDATTVTNAMTNTLTRRENSSYSSFNDFTAPGYYTIGSTANYGGPTGYTTGRRILIVVKGSGTYLYQILINESYKRVHIRSAASGSAFSDNWVELINDTALIRMENPPYNDGVAGYDSNYDNDYDNFSAFGYYTIGYNALVKTGPLGADEKGRRVLLVTAGGSGTKFQILFNESKKRLFIRAYINSSNVWSWQDWKEIGAPAEITFNESKIGDLHAEYADHIGADTSTTEPVGQEIRVMAYNVAKYDNDTDTYLSTKKEKILHFRRLLATVNADYICTPEDSKWINKEDSDDEPVAGDCLSVDWLYCPLYPVKIGRGGAAIHSKADYDHDHSSASVSLQSTSTGSTYTATCRKGIYSVGEKTLGIYSVHMPVRGIPDGLNGATVRHDMLAYLIENVIGQDANAPDYWVIAGDFNALYEGDSTHDSEIKTLLDYCATKNLQVSNGGYFGLYITRPATSRALDYIISSQNTVIRNAEVMSNWFDDLYSDHIPHYADIVLLPTTT